MLEYLVSNIISGTDVFGKPFSIDDAYIIIKKMYPEKDQEKIKSDFETLLIANNIKK